MVSADDYGLLCGELDSVKWTVCQRQKWDIRKIEKLLDELENIGLITRWPDKDTQVIVIELTKFKELNYPGAKKHRAVSQFTQVIDITEQVQVGANGCNRVRQIETETDRNRKEKTDIPRAAGALDAKGLFDLYNETLGDVLPKAKDLTDARKKQITARLAERKDFDWQGYFQCVRSMPHLIGDNNSGWRASLDWLLKPANMAKVIEGNYRKNERPKTDASGEIKKPWTDDPALASLWANSKHFNVLPFDARSFGSQAQIAQRMFDLSRHIVPTSHRDGFEALYIRALEPDTKPQTERP